MNPSATTPVRLGRRARIVALIAVAAALAIPAAASAAPRASTSLTITPALGVYFGQVTSEKPACQRGRTVELFHIEQGGDRLINTYVTKEHGQAGPWAVNTDPNMRGFFYAEIAKNGMCRGAMSGSVQSIAIPLMP